MQAVAVGSAGREAIAALQRGAAAVTTAMPSTPEDTAAGLLAAHPLQRPR
ncbi:MAG: hypothetical protein M3N52_11200 [Actinomycetota bacterium]|nr:hypothetical protein [Actinomycetota bacterium]